MKRIIFSGIAAFVFGVFAPQIGTAQGTTTFVSSISSNATGSVSVGNDSWMAALFYTGNNASGYVFNSVELGMMNDTGNPSGFTVMLYGQSPPNGATLPGTSLGTLTGSANPATGGVYTYTAPPSLTLSPQTAYFILVTSGTTVANGAYEWSESAYPPAINLWGVGNGIMQSSNGGLGWTVTPYLGIAQFAIYASPVPEPGVLGLLALGSLLVGFQRWKTRRLDETNHH